MNAIEKKHYDLVYSHEEEGAEYHATITKDTAVGFVEWCKDNDMTLCIEQGREILTSELYDIYVKSLEG